MNITIDEDPFTRNAQAACKIYHEVLLLMKNLQPQVKNVNNNYYDLYYTNIKK